MDFPSYEYFEQNSLSYFLSDRLFKAFVLVASIVVSVHYIYGFGTKRAKEAFIGLILLSMIIVQYYFLIQATLYIPSNKFYVYDESRVLDSCLYSSKGGKRPSEVTTVEYLNPCYALPAFQNGTNKYISDSRDCKGGFGSHCTKNQPCNPCDMDYIVQYGGQRCRSCNGKNAECGFIEGVGPYCRVHPGSKEVVACKKCCSDSAPVIIDDDVCY